MTKEERQYVIDQLKNANASKYGQAISTAENEYELFHATRIIHILDCSLLEQRFNTLEQHLIQYLLDFIPDGDYDFLCIPDGDFASAQLKEQFFIHKTNKRDNIINNLLYEK